MMPQTVFISWLWGGWCVDIHLLQYYLDIYSKTSLDKVPIVVSV